MPNEKLELYYINIGELAKKFDVSVSLIRYWEKEFKQLNPEKSIKGTRKYSKKNIEIFSTIYQLVKIEGFTIDGAKEKLNHKPIVQNNQQAIEKLAELKVFLTKLKDSI
ncbi:MAG: MerR family transcriptional regulator [Bacteroidia bacterium]|nr:MerR family transcriptional regulator [Bacteroidia bacterium]